MMKMIMDLRRARVREIRKGDVVTVSPDLMWRHYDYKSEENIAARVLIDPTRHEQYDEYWVLDTTYGEFYVPDSGYVGRLRERTKRDTRGDR